MNKKRLIAYALLCLVSILPSALFAQERATADISGIVRSEKGEVLAGVSVIVQNAENNFNATTITDTSGLFTFFRLPAGRGYRLTFSHVGYEAQTRAGFVLKGQANFSIVVKLKESDEALNDVVVIGYGTVKKSDLTGAVAAIQEKDFNKGVVADVDQLIEGKAAGVNIMQTNAQPGGITQIQIRGLNSINASNAPLYVIDGMPIDNSVVNNNSSTSATFSPAPPNPLASINPADIASVEILKDASSTAIYGNRGSNGVVIITTKSGKFGQRPAVSYNASAGFQNISRKYNVMDAADYATSHNAYYDFYASQQPGASILTLASKYPDSSIAAFKSGAGTDWFGLLTRTGVIDNHQLSVSGGTDNTTYYASVNYQDQQGVLQMSDLNRLSVRTNLVQKIGKWAELGVRITGSDLKTDNIPVGTGIAGDSRGGAMSGVLYWAPTIPAYQPDGSITTNPFNATNSNPAGLKLVTNITQESRLLATTYLKANITSHLFFKETVGYDDAISKNEAYVPAGAKNSLASTGEASQSSFTNKVMLYSSLLNFKDQFGKHAIEVTADNDYQTFNVTGFGARAIGFSTSAFSFNNMAAGTTQYAYSSQTGSTLVSFLGRINYTFDDKYLLTLSGRYDGSSKFAAGHKWGYFPSGAIAWKLAKEGFIEKMNVFDDLKVRVSYGKTGNQSIGTNNSEVLLGTTGTPTAIGNSETYPVAPNVPGNNNLTWERTGQFDGGVDYAFFKNRLRGSVDYYKIVTTDLLLAFTLPTTSGFSSIVRNAGATQNEGVEFTVFTDNIRQKDFTWTTDFNIALNKNRWKNRAGLPYAPQEEFGPINGIYGYVVDGIWQQGDKISTSSQPASLPGQYRFKDLHGRDANNNLTNGPNGVLNSDDVTLLGQSSPKTTAGLTNTFGYKQFRLTIFLHGMFGFQIYNTAKAMLDNPYNTLQLMGQSPVVNNHWSPTHTNSNIPSGVPNVYGSDVNSMNIESGNFVRVKTINLSYNVPVKWTWARSLNVYVNVDNAFLFTKYTGLDPESANPAYNTSGTESDVYPPARTYLLGVNINF